MNFGTILLAEIPSGFYSVAMGLLLTAPPRFLAAAAVCGLSGRVVRVLLSGAGMGVGWATLLAAASVVFVAAALLRRNAVPPVVLISGVLPLGAAGTTLDMIIGFMRLSNLQGDALQAASVAFVSSAAKAFLTYLALSVGISLGIALVRLIARDERAAA